MFENKFFSAQTYTNTAIERSWKFSPMLFSGSYCLGCRVQCSSSSLADSVDRSDRSSDLFNKPVWTKLNELPDSLSQKNWSLCICIYIYISWTIQLSWISWKTCLSNLPKCKVEIVKISYKGASLLREVLQLQIDSPSQNLSYVCPQLRSSSLSLESRSRSRESLVAMFQEDSHLPVKDNLSVLSLVLIHMLVIYNITTTFGVSEQPTETMPSKR